MNADRVNGILENKEGVFAGERFEEFCMAQPVIQHWSS